MAPRLFFAVAGLLFALPAHASTGNFMPMLLSFFIAIPVLLLVPAIAIARGSPEWKRKLPWVVALFAVAILSFGSLYWAARVYSLLANSNWYLVYLWVLPPYVLWPVARWRLKNQ